jgi:hypothetical protein
MQIQMGSFEDKQTVKPTGKHPHIDRLVKKQRNKRFIEKKRNCTFM